MSRSTHSGFKRKKIHSMKREVDKITTQIAESEACLDSVRVPSDLVSEALIKQHSPSRSKCVKAKIAELTKKICRAKNRGNKECLLARRTVLRAELRWGPIQLEGAFNGACRRYRIDGLQEWTQIHFLIELESF